MIGSRSIEPDDERDDESAEEGELVDRPRIGRNLERSTQRWRRSRGAMTTLLTELTELTELTKIEIFKSM
ncbi:hypothetical protein O181_068682 [Austropuccinia psidii MF-1]|uniref:Uncharacterized protein n=1 Tax=Austropuccinia psidii MF-1 TaxID=1389203 RepID=A0A9Q3EZS9_9BASI|nr:hypothetical protein [Austropuccinia psidii MF-1]